LGGWFIGKTGQNNNSERHLTKVEKGRGGGEELKEKCIKGAQKEIRSWTGLKEGKLKQHLDPFHENETQGEKKDLRGMKMRRGKEKKKSKVASSPILK